MGFGPADNHNPTPKTTRPLRVAERRKRAMQLKAGFHCPVVTGNREMEKVQSTDADGGWGDKKQSFQKSIFCRVIVEADLLKGDKRSVTKERDRLVRCWGN